MYYGTKLPLESSTNFLKASILTRNQWKLLSFKSFFGNFEHMVSPHKIEDFPANFLERKLALLILYRGGSATPATSKMDFSVTKVQLLILVAKSLSYMLLVYQIYLQYILVYHKKNGVYLSRWYLCALTTSFQRPLNSSLLLDRPIFHQNRGTC